MSDRLIQLYPTTSHCERSGDATVPLVWLQAYLATVLRDVQPHEYDSIEVTGFASFGLQYTKKVTAEQAAEELRLATIDRLRKLAARVDEGTRAVLEDTIKSLGG